jgi:uncharacterized membrane protein SirB2
MSEEHVVESEVFRDRTAWVIAFGIFQAGLASLILAYAVLILVVPMPPSTPSEPRFLAALPGVWGAALLIAGVGLMFRKNWARVTSLVLNSLWLFGGIFGLLAVVVLFPGIVAKQPSMLAEPQRVLFSSVLAVVAAMLVVPPALLLFFCSRKSVRATCLAGSPPRQGVRRPVAVVVLASWAAVGTLGSLAGVGLFDPAAILFGTVLNGPMAVAVLLTNSALSAGVTWGVWRQRAEGWWAALFLSLFWAVSGAVSSIRKDWWSTMRELRPSQPVLETPYDTAVFGQVIGVSVVILGAAFVVLVLYARRYFPARSSPSLT